MGGAGGGFFVGARDEVLPGGADVGWVAMVGSLVDEKAEVIIGGLVGVLVVENVDAEDAAVELGEEGGLAIGGDARVAFKAKQQVGLYVG